VTANDGIQTRGATNRRPARAALVLTTLILGAIVANINTSISNVALPDIGKALSASNQQLTFITDAYQIAIASTVLYLGAVGDRYGRKRLLLIGAALCVPFSILSSLAHSSGQLVLAQMATGVAGGMLYPTTLSLITALFSGRAMTRAVALWMGIGAGASVFGPLAGGYLLEHFWWGSVFLVTTPLAAAVFVLAFFLLPRHSGEGTGRLDHPGGILSILMVMSFVVMVVLLPQGLTPTIVGLLVVAVVSGVLFVLRERRARDPLFDLHLAAAPTFWVAFVAGLITFGALIGAAFIGQQFTQNVLGFDPLKAAAVTLAMAATMIAAAPVAGRLIHSIGTRLTLAAGLVAIALGFLVMDVTWRPGTHVAWVLVAYAFLGAGVGLAGTPASRSLTASLPVRRVGMGSASADLTKDLGGAVFQAILGTILTISYAAYFARAFAALPAAEAQKLGSSAAAEMASSFAGARHVAATMPGADAGQLVAAARDAFSDGKTLAITFALAAALAGIALVLWKYPRHADEVRELEAVAAQNEAYLVAGETGGTAAGGEQPALGAPPGAVP
jgi:EmrB/QacA subfamily drug resistance transporter